MKVRPLALVIVLALSACRSNSADFVPARACTRGDQKLVADVRKGVTSSQMKELARSFADEHAGIDGKDVITSSSSSQKERKLRFVLCKEATDEEVAAMRERLIDTGKVVTIEIADAPR